MTDIFFTQADWQLFLNINTLPQQAGVAKYLLTKLLAKELTDNALDASPDVTIEQEIDDHYNTTLRFINKNKTFQGDDDTIAHLFSVKRPLTSSKRLRLPKRGALGNGLRVVVAIVYCLKGNLKISTSGRTLQLIPQDDGTTTAIPIAPYEGTDTIIEVIIPENIFGTTSLDWAEKALKINQGTLYEGKTNAYWYDSDSFFSLCQTSPSYLTLLSFILLFEGINTNKAKQISQLFSSNTITNTLNRQQAEQLLTQLRENSQPLPPKKMGAVGTIPNFDAYYLQQASYELPTTQGNHNAQIPCIIEFFAQTSPDIAQIQFFVNRTPIIGEVGISYLEKNISIFGCGLHLFTPCATLLKPPIVWVNVLTPYMPIVSNGKEPDLSVLNHFISEGITKISNQLRKKQLQANTNNFSISQEKIPSQKQIVIEYLTQAINKASGEGQYRYSLRQLYYALRPIVITHTQKELKYAHFTQLITEYEYETGKDLQGIYRDERGTLLHPHTHQEIRLGTKNIEKYQRPVYNFNKILYSEKEGFFEILKDTGFLERYDCALLTSKGFASRAARDVIDLLANTEEALTFFCIHDADLSGTLIYQALQGATKARPERKVNIINLGLEPWEGLKMGLEVEKLEKKSNKKAADYIQKQPTEILPQDFINPQYTQPNWEEWLQHYRIELNAMDTPTFLNWLEQKIQPYHTQKVIPDTQYLQTIATQTAENTLKNQIRTMILQKLNIENQIEQELHQHLPELIAKIQQQNLQDAIAQALSENPTHNWLHSLQEILEKISQNKA
ncbi:MAG: hypothetical protein EAZ55_01595 [Cytophagales bacterium]|nr:MAG: hypothetical protein EAZ55_01595 [Cytophagales bacterium]